MSKKKKKVTAAPPPEPITHDQLPLESLVRVNGSLLPERVVAHSSVGVYLSSSRAGLIGEGKITHVPLSSIEKIQPVS